MQPYTVLNISITGAAGVLGTQLRIDSVHPFHLDVLDINARVVRIREVESGWETAIDFIHGSHSAHEIGAVLTRLVRDVRRP